MFFEFLLAFELIINDLESNVKLLIFRLLQPC